MSTSDVAVARARSGPRKRGPGVLLSCSPALSSTRFLPVYISSQSRESGGESPRSVLTPFHRSAAAGEMVVGEAANQAGSTTVVTVSTVAAAQTEATAPTHLTLKLKRRRSRVRWAEDVVDNEDLCRKKSKKCCIFHRSRGLDESSDEEDGPEKLLANFLPPSSSEAAASSTE